MIALSSHRPHSKSREFAFNQRLAWLSWQGCFNKIIYAGPPEAELQSRKTVFIQTEDFPTIQTLAKIASEQSEESVAVLNADICVGHRFGQVKLRMQSMLCASSRRWHFDPTNPQNFENAVLIDSDRGRDIFIAKKRVWKRIADLVPGHLRIGHQQWDAWMTDYFNSLKPSFFDFTGIKCIFHPNHGDRQMPYADQIVNAIA